MVAIDSFEIFSKRFSLCICVFILFAYIPVQRQMMTVPCHEFAIVDFALDSQFSTVQMVGIFELGQFKMQV
jgi:hypothetical protein